MSARIALGDTLTPPDAHAENVNFSKSSGPGGWADFPSRVLFS